MNQVKPNATLAYWHHIIYVSERDNKRKIIERIETFNQRIIIQGVDAWERNTSSNVFYTYQDKKS